MLAEKRRCNARNRAGKQCGRYVDPERPEIDKCRFHGGASRRGPASATFKHGRYSRALPARYRKAFEEAFGDRDIVTLRGQIALLDAREEELLTRLSTGESGATWFAAQRAMEDFHRAVRESNHSRQAQTLATLAKIIGDGAKDERVWHELRDNINLRRRVAEAERRRIEALHSYLTAEEVILFAGNLVQLIATNVTDRASLDAIVRGVEHLLGDSLGKAALEEKNVTPPGGGA